MLHLGKLRVCHRLMNKSIK